MAAGLGLEPRYYAPEAHVLPLDDPARLPGYCTPLPGPLSRTLLEDPRDSEADYQGRGDREADERQPEEVVPLLPGLDRLELEIGHVRDAEEDRADHEVVHLAEEVRPVLAEGDADERTHDRAWQVDHERGEEQAPEDAEQVRRDERDGAADGRHPLRAFLDRDRGQDGEAEREQDARDDEADDADEHEDGREDGDPDVGRDHGPRLRVRGADGQLVVTVVRGTPRDQLRERHPGREDQHERGVQERADADAKEQERVGDQAAHDVDRGRGRVVRACRARGGDAADAGEDRDDHHGDARDQRVAGEELPVLLPGGEHLLEGSPGRLEAVHLVSLRHGLVGRDDLHDDVRLLVSLGLEDHDLLRLGRLGFLHARGVVLVFLAHEKSLAESGGRRTDAVPAGPAARQEPPVPLLGQQALRDPLQEERVLRALDQHRILGLEHRLDLGQELGDRREAHHRHVPLLEGGHQVRGHLRPHEYGEVRRPGDVRREVRVGLRRMLAELAHVAEDRDTAPAARDVVEHAERV